MQDVDVVTGLDAELLKRSDLVEAIETALEVQRARSLAQSDDSRARECRHEADLVALPELQLVADPGTGVGERETALSVGVVHLDRVAAVAPEHVVGQGTLGTDHVDGDGEDVDDRLRELVAVSRGVHGRAEDAASPTLVTLHAAATLGLEAVATAVVDQTLAHVGADVVGRTAERIDANGDDARRDLARSGDAVDQAHACVLVTRRLQDRATLQTREGLDHYLGEGVDRQDAARLGREPARDVGRAGQLETLLQHTTVAEPLPVDDLHAHGTGVARVARLVRAGVQQRAVDGHADEGEVAAGEHDVGDGERDDPRLAVPRVDDALADHRHELHRTQRLVGRTELHTVRTAEHGRGAGLVARGSRTALEEDLVATGAVHELDLDGVVEHDIDGSTHPSHALRSLWRDAGVLHVLSSPSRGRLPGWRKGK